MIEDFDRLYVYKLVRENRTQYKIIFNKNRNFLKSAILFDRFATDIETNFPIYIDDVNNIHELKLYVNKFGRPKKKISFKEKATQKQVVCKIKSLKKSGII